MYSSAELAIKAIEENQGDMFEYFYDYAVVECYTVDAAPFPKEVAWFQLLRYENNKAIIEPCTKPENLKNICNFSLG